MLYGQQLERKFYFCKGDMEKNYVPFTFATLPCHFFKKVTARLCLVLLCGRDQ